MNTETNSSYTQNHLASALVMVHPVDFGFNEETGIDNEFQNRPSTTQEEIKRAAQREFEVMTDLLARKDVSVTLLGKPHTSSLLPDAVFPNNWFSTRTDGTLFIYPMKTVNRQAEVQIEALQQLLRSEGFVINKIEDLRTKLPNNQILEGTGSLIFHHPSAQVFAAISERCQLPAAEWFANQYGYHLNSTHSQSRSGSPIYHTNVLMSCGEDFAVVADSTITTLGPDNSFLEQLHNTVSEIILITESQMATSFCGNIIQLVSQRGTPSIVMSQSAYQGFNPKQIKSLERHGDLIVVDISTIEHVGGGSARCMIAENFLPKID